jgi:hypothetical protein
VAGRGAAPAAEAEPGEMGEAADLEAEAAPASTAPRPNQFGSVWDSQIGMAGRPDRLAPLPADEDDFAEPEIPEYLLAERRRSGTGGRGRGQTGGRGSRSAYASAVERERFGRTASRYPEPARQPMPQRRRDERPARPVQPVVRRGEVRQVVRDSAEPWSEVPPELEELLRAQLSTKLTRSGGELSGAPVSETVAAAEPAPNARAAAGARRGGRRKAEAAPEATAPEAAEPTLPADVEASGDNKPKPAPRTRRKPAVSAEADGASSSEVGSSAPAEAAVEAEKAAPRRRAPARRKAATQPAETSGQSSAE